MHNATPRRPRITMPVWVGGGQDGYDPWLHLGACEGVNLTWHAQGDMGKTDFESATISLLRGMTVRQARSTLAHELVHLERGPVCVGASDLEEHLVEATSALRLIPAFVLNELPELLDRHGVEACCDLLGVDESAIRAATGGIKVGRSL